MTDLHQQFEAEIDAFLERSGLEPWRFGKVALGDPNFMADLRIRKRSPTLKTIEKVREFIAGYGQ